MTISFDNYKNDKQAWKILANHEKNKWMNRNIRITGVALSVITACLALGIVHSCCPNLDYEGVGNVLKDYLAGFIVAEVSLGILLWCFIRQQRTNIHILMGVYSKPDIKYENRNKLVVLEFAELAYRLRQEEINEYFQLHPNAINQLSLFELSQLPMLWLSKDVIDQYFQANPNIDFNKIGPFRKNGLETFLEKDDCPTYLIICLLDKGAKVDVRNLKDSVRNTFLKVLRYFDSDLYTKLERAKFRPNMPIIPLKWFLEDGKYPAEVIEYFIEKNKPLRKELASALDKEFPIAILPLIQDYFALDGRNEIRERLNGKLDPTIIPLIQDFYERVES